MNQKILVKRLFILQYNHFNSSKRLISLFFLAPFNPLFAFICIAQIAVSFSHPSNSAKVLKLNNIVNMFDALLVFE